MLFSVQYANKLKKLKLKLLIAAMEPKLCISGLDRLGSYLHPTTLSLCMTFQE